MNNSDEASVLTEPKEQILMETDESNDTFCSAVADQSS